MSFRGPKAHPNRGEKPPRTSRNLLRLLVFFMKFRGPKAHPNRGEKPPRTSGNLQRLPAFFMKFRGRNAHPNRFEKPPRGVGSEPGDRQDWQRISGKMRRKSMPVLSVPGALVGGDEVTMAVFHELSRAEGPSQQT